VAWTSESASSLLVTSRLALNLRVHAPLTALRMSMEELSWSLALARFAKRTVELTMENASSPLLTLIHAQRIRLPVLLTVLKELNSFNLDILRSKLLIIRSEYAKRTAAWTLASASSRLATLNLALKVKPAVPLTASNQYL
jgi:hypothetical protein